VRVRADGRSGAEGWLALEAVPGETLEAWLAHNRLDPDDVPDLLATVGEAVAAAHRAGVRHRDLKPANIVRRPDGAVVLVDFGAASLQGEPPASAGALSALTDGYAAPEQYCSSAPEGPWTDVYGLAALGYRMLTGLPPPASPARARLDTVGPVRDRRPECPGELGTAIDRGLALDPDARPQTVAAWLGLLGYEPVAGEPDRETVVPEAAAPPAAATDQATPAPAAVRPREDAVARTVAAPPNPSHEPPEQTALEPAPEVVEPSVPRDVEHEVSSPTSAAAAVPHAVEAPLQPDGDRGDDGPPTVLVARRPAPSLPAGGTAVAPDRPMPSSPGVRRRWPAVLLAIMGLLLLEAAVALAFGWRQLQTWRKDEWVVDAAGAGDVASVGEAIERAKDGARVVVRPGSYPEPVTLLRPLALVAADPTDPPRLGCATIGGVGAQMRHFVLAGTGEEACLVVQSGNPILEAVDVGAAAAPALVVRGGASPEIAGGDLTSETGPAVLFDDGAAGTLREATVSTAAGPAVVIRGGAMPEIGQSTIAGGGVLVVEGARPVLRENRLENARGNAIEVASAAAPEIVGNTIAAPAESGVFVYGAGRARLEANIVEEPGLSGIVVTEAGAAEMTGNTVRGAQQHGILVVEGGGGTIEGNTVTGAAGHGIVVGPGTTVTLGENQLEENDEPQLFDGRAS
jgi:hypothetical protein